MHVPFFPVLEVPFIDIGELREDEFWVILTLVWEPEDGPLMGFRGRLNRDY